jgi:hypothetical protein
MTKNELVQRVARRLLMKGDTDFETTVLEPIVDDVIRELAQRDAIGALRKSTTFNLVQSQQNYDTRTITGLSAPDYPAEIRRLIVYAWGWTEGRLVRRSDPEFERAMLEDGSTYEARPRIWRTYPNEQQLQVYPLPDADNDAAVVTIEYIAPPTVLGTATEISEIRDEDLPTIMAGVYRYGVAFQDETITDQRRADLLFEQGIQRMKARRERARFAGRRRQVSYRDY